MILKKITYKGKVDFDYFTIWIDDDLYCLYDHELFELGGGRLEDRATSVSTKICPWCVKKYGLYDEVDRTPEDVEDEIKFYADEDPEDLDFTCGVAGCNNGAADDVDLNWKNNFTVSDCE